MSFKLGVVTDEIDADPAVALPAAREMGLTHLEFNKVGEKGVHELSGADIAELRRMVAGEGLEVVAVDPPSFKAIELDEVPIEEVTRHAAVAEHLEQVRRSCEVAGELGAGIVRLFSFRRGYVIGAGNPSPREPRGGAIPDDLLPKIVAGLRA
ncbi:MAG: TIM barrel protein, partial [Spirochaetaceae bacterium]|nr:TIM barrel protein [Spirochaetaceae bacterium]